MEHNHKLGEIYKEQAVSLGMHFDESYIAQTMHIGKLMMLNMYLKQQCIPLHN